VSIRPVYGSNGARGRPGYGQAAQEAAWPTWRDVRPVLLKSAGIVGLAGAIMAVVSSNALFVDPGGPSRDRPKTAAEDLADPKPTVLASSLATSSAEDPVRVIVLQTTVSPLPPVETPEPETTSSVTPAASAPAQLPPAETAPLTADAAMALPAETASVAADASVVPPAAAGPFVAPVAAETQAVASADPIREQPVAPSTDESAPAAWPQEAVACPRDWVAVPGADGQPATGAACDTIAALVQTGGEAPPLRKVPSEDVLDLVAVAPTMPVPGPGGDANADATDTEKAVEQTPQPPQPAPVRTSRRADWPSEPPPDCGALHAYWHFVDGHHGAKEWYCK
jgi:hypothetical protein